MSLRSRACPTTGSDRGSLRDHDLTLFVQADGWRAAKKPDLACVARSFIVQFLLLWRAIVGGTQASDLKFGNASQ